MYALHLQADMHHTRQWKESAAAKDKPLVSRATPSGTLECLIKNFFPTHQRFIGELGPTSPIFNQPNAIPRCPNQPPYEIDPRTIAIAGRRYFPSGASDWSKRAGAIQGQVLVDARTFTTTVTYDHIPRHQLRYFTQLGGTFNSLIFPGRIIEPQTWPLDVPTSTATNMGERLIELTAARLEVEELYQTVRSCLTDREVHECTRPHITLYKRATPDSSQLTAVKVDRIFFWQRIHPTWNPFVKPTESTFLRSAQYFFKSSQRLAEADAINTILRTPQNDDWEVRELVALGALEGEFRKDEALEYLREVDDEHWDFHASETTLKSAPLFQEFRDPTKALRVTLPASISEPSSPDSMEECDH